MANEKNLKPNSSPATRITSGRVAREMQLKSAAAKKRNNLERKLIKERIIERMGAKDWEEVINGVIERAKATDKGFEVLRDTIGEKPKEDINVNGSINNPFENLTTEELKKLADLE